MTPVARAPHACVARGLLAAVAALAACALVPACTQTANVSDVFMALDGEGDRKRLEFFTDTSEIHCVTQIGVGRPGVTLEVLIRQIQGYDAEANRFFDTDRVFAYVEVTPSPADGAQLVDFPLTPLNAAGEPDDEAPFPAGRFQCEVRLDGKLEGVALYNIRFPPCPTSALAGRPDKAVCQGFYEVGRECPAYGLESRDPDRCRCTNAGLWDCGTAR